MEIFFILLPLMKSNVGHKVELWSQQQYHWVPWYFRLKHTD